MASTDFTRTERLFRTARLLRREPLTVRDLAAHLFPEAGRQGVNRVEAERIVEQDLQDLERLEPDDFHCVPGRPPRYLLRTQRTTVSPTTVLSLHAAARQMAGAVPVLRPHLLAALAQLTDWLPERVQPVLQRSLGDAGKSRAHERPHLERVCAAWMGGHPLRFEYLRPGRSAARRTNIIEIYLVEVDPVTADLCLIGRETTYHHAVRTYRLSRMRALHVLEGEQYSIPEAFDPQAYVHGVWGRTGEPDEAAITVHLRFRHDAAYRILEGGFAQLSEPFLNPDGTIDTSLQVRDEKRELPHEVFAWILGWGSAVQVLGPPEVRARWQKEVRAAANQVSFAPLRFPAGGAA
ncbi:helix-turn-helix transcriptional regulator [Deinococcus hopiensis]|uniref:Predicted DNA-binding transcriptional regulator YafY, contains an HTH and WYL domains n=1 Tax=Deinococcus hopiensis KR-140 TaxID=695939 RepID=A0A1W1ULL7_9DEIO|nr:WYL domain-containing protein [Deinococcus hopiensis]SMB82025.1 Predicted DNA-binding transcriptional regulator YafY, contains an HTH and WYL domains [Deinococcus hopiensis KR-140]